MGAHLAPGAPGEPVLVLVGTSPGSSAARGGLWAILIAEFQGFAQHYAL